MPDKITKFIESLDAKTKARLKLRLLELQEKPYYQKHVEKMSDRGPNIYRLRVGKIRIIYSLMNGQVEIEDIDFRGNIY